MTAPQHTPADIRPTRSGAGVRVLAAGHRPLLVTGVVLGLCGVVASLAQPLAVGHLVGAAGRAASLTWPVTLVVLLFCAEAGFAALHAHLVGRAGGGAGHDVRRLARLVVDGCMLAGGAVLLCVIDVTSALVALGCLALVAARSLGALRAESSAPERVRAQPDGSRLSGVLGRTRHGLLVSPLHAGIRMTFAVVLCVGMSRVATGSTSLAAVTASVLCLVSLATPLVTVLLAADRFRQEKAAGRGAGAPVTPLPEGTPPTGTSEPQEHTPAAAGTGTPAVEFDGVTFAHGDTGDALHDVSFTVPARGLTAVVGPSGAGKTTLFQLLERLHRPRRGVIRVGGHDIAGLPLDRLRGTVGYVQQDRAVMRGTLREYLVHAGPGATEEEIHEAVRMTDLAGVVESLPQGLDTPLGGPGGTLSGGQRQRLSIARTLLQKPDVILLDEPTAHLDSDSEADLRRTLRRISRRCTVIAVAHLVSTVADADRVVVLDRGHLQDIGSHGELTARNPFYRRLADAQLRPAPEPDGTPSVRPPSAAGNGAGRRVFIPAQRRRT